MKSVADYIATKFSLEAVPGKKGTCPFCGKGTFSINSEDTIGKCFHPDCGRHVSSTTMRNEVEDIIQTALKSVMAQCRAALFDGTPLSAQALEYLQGERKIHELVIRESYIGVVPANIDISTPFGAAIQALQISLHGVSNNTRRAKIEEGLEKLGGMQAKLAATTGKALNYICFFYTDDQLNITQIRFRKPFTKQFMSWAGDKRKGVFGLPLMVASEDVGPLIVVEGEFNLLRMQSVAIGKGSDELTNKVFSNVVALGSASGPDFDTLMALSSFPVFVHDNDAAGKSVVNAALDRMYLKACTTPLPAKDLDEYVDAFGDIDAAWFGIQQLLDSAAAYYRNLTSIMAEIRGVRNSGYREFKTNQFVSEIVLRDLIIRAKLLKNSGRGYLFNLESKRLIRLEKDAAEFASLM